MKKLIFTMITFCLSLILLVSLSELLLRFAGYQPWSYIVQTNEPTAYEYDPVLGWKNKEGNYIYPAYVPTGKDIKVTFLADGSRVTAEKRTVIKVDERDKLIFLGGSFTQGWAISDHKTYPWKLQAQYPSVKVLNYGTGGYGTYQSLLILEKVFKNSEYPAMVIYGFMWHHEDRNVAPSYWLKMLSQYARRGHVYLPYGTVDNQGSLLRHPPESYSIWPLSQSLAIVDYLQYLYTTKKSLNRSLQGKLVTEKLLLEMGRLCKEKETKFIVALLNFYTEEQKFHYINFLNKNQIEAIDCVYPMTPEMTVKGEGHPNEKMNTLWASCIAKAIDNNLN